jgi:hypothetical protein
MAFHSIDEFRRALADSAQFVDSEKYLGDQSGDRARAFIGYLRGYMKVYQEDAMDELLLHILKPGSKSPPPAGATDGDDHGNG